MNRDPDSSFVTKVVLRQSIVSIRLVIALFVVAATVTKLLYNRILPGLEDLDFVRWAIIGLGCVLFAATWIRRKRGLIVTYFSLFLYLCTLLYVIAFVVINDFDPATVTILILVVGASTVFINTVFYYTVQGGLIVLVLLLAYDGAALESPNMIAFFNLVLGLGVFGIVTAVRIKLVSSLKDSHANLEKLNVLSIVADKNGRIVFVSPSARNLLGYEPKELVKDGWWHSENLRDGWISRDYILNYPNILPRELVSMETTLRHKDGKTLHFNWSNSLLANGSYVGVGLDITKYKVAGVAEHTT